jgi:hypothetical protein
MTDWVAIEEEVMGGLAPFQRRTVEWAFSRLYPKDGSRGSGRFLVADEVGLGKTMVAKGVLAKALRYLSGRAKRADVVYVCSNASIAQQNLDRLRIKGVADGEFQSQGRLTLLPLIGCDGQGEPLRDAAFRAGGVNFLSLTPATSLDVSRDVGQSVERALMCAMLRGQVDGVSDTQMRNLFTSRVATETFDRQLQRIEQSFVIDQGLSRRFVKRVNRARGGMAGEIQVLAEKFKRRKVFDYSAPEQKEAYELIGRLRTELARVCIDAVEPDLVILDEFQRFAELLRPETPDGELARQLLEYEKDGEHARVLLLSATPYRMSSFGESEGDAQHHDEFLRTVGFLLNNEPAPQDALKEDLDRFNVLLRRLDLNDLEPLLGCRKRLEDRLRGVVARTDRVPATEDRDAMVVVPPLPVMPSVEDLVAYVSLKHVADVLKQPDLLEYWRSAAFPLSFLSGYKLRDRLKEAIDAGEPVVLAALRLPGLFLPTSAEPHADGAAAPVASARAQALARELVDAGMHELLWVPPALPLYALGGSYAAVGEAGRTKRLLFSSWRMVPRSVSTVVDSAMVSAIGRLSVGIVANRHEWARSDFALVYPCETFAAECRIGALVEEVLARGDEPDFDAVVSRAEHRIQPLLEGLQETYCDPESSAPDVDWYWLAPLLIDRTFWPLHGGASDSLLDWSLGTRPEQRTEADSSAMPWLHDSGGDLPARLRDILDNTRRPGRMPADLLQTLARIAVASPGNCALRSMEAGESKSRLPVVRRASMSIASSLLAYLGNEQAVAILGRADDRREFWRLALEHCGQGCLQAVLDEYVAVLKFDKPSIAAADDRSTAMAQAMADSLRLRPAVLRPEALEEVEGRLSLRAISRTLRHCRPLLEDKADDDGGSQNTMSQLRGAFNSPFLPFVLSSTSIGQEGLDFHWYCHTIIHWNLPSNPVDFEQRDGRIHRYRNHAVRRNLAQDWGAVALAPETRRAGGSELWEMLFEQASAQLQSLGRDMDGMMPSWIYRKGDCVPTVPAPQWMSRSQGRPAQIVRQVPMIPLSRDPERLEEMTRAVGCYRIVFAQPRQYDLLAHLIRGHEPAVLAKYVSQLAIDLRPPEPGA